MFEVRDYLMNYFWKFKTKEESSSIKESRYFQNKISYIESIEDIQQNTTETYARMFLNYFYNLENVLNKDLYEFNLEELRLAIKGIRTTSLSLKSSVMYLIKNYIEWAYQKGYRATANDMQILEDEEGLIDVDRSRIENEYLSLREAYNICDRALKATFISGKKRGTDYNDCLIFLLIRYGFKGRELCELKELTIDMVDRKKLTIKYHNEAENYTKEIIIDEDLLFYIDEAHALHGLNRLVEIKSLINLRRRLAELQKDAECTNILSISNIFNSRIIDELDSIHERNGVVMVEDIQRVKKMFEAESAASSYTSLKNYYSKLRNIEIKKASRRKSSENKEIDNLLKEVLG